MPDQASAFAAPTDQSGQPALQPTTPANPFADQLAMIKNEDGAQKYDTPEKALEALKHSQEYIPQLQKATVDKDAEIARLTTELATRSSVEDVVSRLTASQSAPQAAPEPTAPVAPQGLTQEQVASLVQQELTRTQQVTTARTNAEKVNDALVKSFGDKANATVVAKAKELNTTPQALEQLASQSPDMVLALFNAAPGPGVTVTQGSVNLPPTTPQGESLKAPEKSLLSGSTSDEQKDFWTKIKADTYAKYGVIT